MKINISADTLIACLCEGGAERTIMNLLLDNDMLIFSREQLVEGNVISRIGVKDFERRYLRVDYGKQIMVLRILDSHSEEFNLSKAYRCQVGVINVVTAPEIEMLIIIGEGKYENFQRSDIQKPSDYCKQVLKMKRVKSPEFVRDYFSNLSFLRDCIEEYHRLHKQKNHEASLFDLIRT